MQLEDITSPFDGAVVGQVPVTKISEIEDVISKSVKSADLWRHTPAHIRNAVLLKAAAIAEERSEEIAQIISSENGKSLLEARGEASRSSEIIRLAAFEGSQLYGSSLPLDANKGTGLEKLGFTLRQPVGVVVAISPFNYPALLVLHKIAPALAVGNSVVLKPARATPLTAIALAKCFTDAGLPEGVLQVVHGAGSELGNALVTDSRVRKISFTGSTATGAQISSVAGIKKLSLELGSSCPVIVMDDADIDYAADAVALGGYINAGQVCISVQRVIVHEKVMANFLDALKPRVEAIKVGDPKSADTKVGTLISETEAIRVEKSIAAAVSEGATLLTGGARTGTIIKPAIVCGVNPKSAFAQDELFGPAIAVSSTSGITDAISIANGSAYGLGAGVFTKNMENSIQAARELDAGIIHINWTPLWRADLMPYGGLKSSGIGKEGVRSTVNEMTEEKTIILHGRSWQ
jgi:acyl-CoA reductase-like NAD-dependent aldehyde dehydrogenase